MPKHSTISVMKTMVGTVKQALECKELWRTNNGVSICYSCHKDIEKLRAKLRNVFYLSRQIRE